MGNDHNNGDDSIESIQRSLEILFRIHTSRRWQADCTTHAGVQLTKASFDVLRLLAGATAMPIGKLADLVGTDRTATTRTVDKLHHDGYVERTTSRHDRRLIVLSITPRGLDVFQRVATVMHERLVATFVRWTDRDVAAFAHLLNDFVDRTANSELRAAHLRFETAP